MEDERIAKTLLSALLKKEVVAVEMRRNEYTNGVRDNISMFRIDFGAHVKEPDGTIRLVLIELQKTWLETETLRFRQYLGAQYSNPENVPSENNKDGYAPSTCWDIVSVTSMCQCSMSNIKRTIMTAM